MFLALVLTIKRWLMAGVTISNLGKARPGTWSVETRWMDHGNVLSFDLLLRSPGQAGVPR